MAAEGGGTPQRRSHARRKAGARRRRAQSLPALPLRAGKMLLQDEPWERNKFPSKEMMETFLKRFSDKKRMYLQWNESSKEHSKNGCKAGKRVTGKKLHRRTGVREEHRRIVKHS